MTVTFTVTFSAFLFEVPLATEEEVMQDMMMGFSDDSDSFCGFDFSQDEFVEAAEMEEKLKSNKFTLQDFYDQMVQMRSMGSMQDILAQLPGGANMKNIQLDEKAMAHTEAIILSMTPKERENPGIIGASRKKRIAAGAGVKVEDVNRLLSQYRQMQKMFKQMNGKKSKKMQKRMRNMPGMMNGFNGGGFPM